MVRLCPELSPIAPNPSALVRNGPFLSEMFTNSFKVSPPTNSLAGCRRKCYMYTPAMAKSTPNLYRDILEKLAAEPPTTKTALLCSLLFEIEVALRSGDAQTNLATALRRRPRYHLRNVLQTHSPGTQEKAHIRGPGREKR